MAQGDTGELLQVRDIDGSLISGIDYLIERTNKRRGSTTDRSNVIRELVTQAVRREQRREQRETEAA